MELINGGNGGNGKEDVKQEVEKAKLTDTQMLRQFAGELNEVLQKGYPMTVVLQVLESAIFEMRLGLYMAQMEQMEKEKRNQIQIPKMTIPNTKNTK